MSTATRTPEYKGHPSDPIMRAIAVLEMMPEHKDLANALYDPAFRLDTYVNRYGPLDGDDDWSENDFVAPTTQMDVPSSFALAASYGLIEAPSDASPEVDF